MTTHLAYSVGLYHGLVRPLVAVSRLVTIAIWGDVLFGALTALVTEEATSGAGRTRATWSPTTSPEMGVPSIFGWRPSRRRRAERAASHARDG